MQLRPWITVTSLGISKGSTQLFGRSFPSLNNPVRQTNEMLSDFDETVVDRTSFRHLQKLLSISCIFEIKTLLF